jgi:hypothetical protein
LNIQISVADLQIQEEDDSLEQSAKIIAQMLYWRDFHVVKETLARIEFEKDFSRLPASRQRLSAAIASTKMSQQRATKLRETMNGTFDGLADQHDQLFTHTSLFKSVRPVLETYYTARFVGAGTPGTRFPLTV